MISYTTRLYDVVDSYFIYDAVFVDLLGSKTAEKDRKTS
jgi:hypothetical protein